MLMHKTYVCLYSRNVARTCTCIYCEVCSSCAEEHRGVPVPSEVWGVPAVCILYTAHNVYLYVCVCLTCDVCSLGNHVAALPSDALTSSMAWQ